MHHFYTPLSADYETNAAFQCFNKFKMQAAYASGPTANGCNDNLV